MKIAFIQTGGTIDKDYPQKTKGYAFEITTPAVQRILEKLEPVFEFEVFPYLQKDSLDITEEDRKNLYNFISKLPHNKLIITHGTDTMIETANFLNGISGKCIILTGAKRPERFVNSDAAANLGVAIGALNVMHEGVFISMQGRIIPANKATHDKKTGDYGFVE